MKQPTNNITHTKKLAQIKPPKPTTTNKKRMPILSSLNILILNLSPGYSSPAKIQGYVLQYSLDKTAIHQPNPSKKAKNF